MYFGDFLDLAARTDLKETFYLEYAALHQYLGQVGVSVCTSNAMCSVTR